MSGQNSLRRAAPAPRPDGVLIELRAGHGDAVDCYAVDIDGTAAIADLIGAFFGSRAFQPERWFLTFLLRKPSSPAAAAALASGQSDNYAAWTVEQRRAGEILLRDFLGVTRCWLMAHPVAAGAQTRLYFGTAFAARRGRSARAARPPVLYILLRPLHAVYARFLLNSAAARLKRISGAAQPA